MAFKHPWCIFSCSLFSSNMRQQPGFQKTGALARKQLKKYTNPGEQRLQAQNYQHRFDRQTTKTESSPVYKGFMSSLDSSAAHRLHLVSSVYFRRQRWKGVGGPDFSCFINCAKPNQRVEHQSCNCADKTSPDPPDGAVERRIISVIIKSRHLMLHWVPHLLRDKAVKSSVVSVMLTRRERSHMRSFFSFSISSHAWLS